MIYVVICDDELHMLNHMERIIYNEFNRYHCNFNIVKVNHPHDKRIINSKADIYFLDIDMPEINGILLAKKLRARHPSAVIVFVTNRDELVYDSFEANPFRFIRKEEFEEKIPKVISDFLEKIKIQQRYLIIEVNRKVIRIFQNEILFIEKMKNHICIHMADNNEYTIRSSITELEKLVNQKLFLKIFPSILVNMTYIKEFLKDTVLIGDMIFPVSRRMKQKARIKYMSFLIEE